jgi:flagellar hook-associated protein 2
MTNRITGTNSGIDVDSVVKQSLTNEQSKIDKAYQQQKVYEYQQQQLKEIVEKTQKFYDKYLDILSGDSLLKSTAYESVSFTSTDSSGVASTAVTAKGFAGADVDDYTVTVTQLAAKANAKISSEGLKSDDEISIVFGSSSVKVNILKKENSDEPDFEKTVKELNTLLKKQGINITAKYSEFSKGIVLESGEMGKNISFDYAVKGADGLDRVVKTTAIGKDAEGIIEKNGEKCEITGNKNIFTVDNVQFTLNSTTNSDGITLNGKTDISNLKDTIVNFVNDYNDLMQSINEKLWETRDRDYMPLTDEQKEEMSDKEIEAWEKKATTGLLRNDSDLRRIQSSMKSAMSSMMSSTGLTLESIGIEPVDNYTTKNGMFKIDEDKLTSALQNNAEEVKDLFTRSASGNDKGGILTQLQSTLKSEVKLSTSSLSKRIGFEGTSTESSNTLSKNILKQKSLITELKEKYSDKETALYKKYSSLEVMLEKLNAQTNSLYSMLGIS